MATTYEIVYKIAGELSSQFSKTFKIASGSIAKTRETMETLAKTASKTEQLVKYRNEAIALNRTLGVQKQSYEQLTSAMAKCQTPQENLIALSKKQKAEIDRTDEALTRKRKAIKELRSELGLHAQSVETLTKRSKLLNKALAFKTRADNMTPNIKSANAEAMASAGMAAMLGSQMIKVGGAPVKQAMAIEDAMADIKKVVDFKEPDGLKKMQADLQKMSLTLPMNTVELMKITAAAGQAGIAEKDLLKFTEAAAKMGVAFDMSAEDAGEMMAKWRSGMNLTQEEAVSLADATNALSNNNAALGKQIGETLQRYGALGKVAGLTEKQTAALAATVIGSGAEAEVAATGINAFMRALVKGDSMSKGQKSAFKDLELDPTQLQKEIKTDAPKAILKVLERIKKVRPEEQMRTLTDMFGEEGARAMGPMLANTQLLAKNFELVADKTKFAGSMEAEFAARAATTSNAFVLAKNAIDYVSGAIGESLLPALKENLEYFVSVGAAIGKWIKENPKLVSNITKLVITLGGLVLGFHTLRAIFLYAYSACLSTAKGVYLIRSGFNAWLAVSPKVVAQMGRIAATLKGVFSQAVAFASAGFAKFMAFIPKAVTSIKALGLAMKAFFLSPVGIAIAAIAALVAAGVLIYKNWDTIKEKLSELWTKFEQTFPGMASTISGVYDNYIKPAVDNITTAFNNLMTFITGGFSEQWSQAWTAISNKFASIFGSITDFVKVPMNGVIALVNKAIASLNAISVEIPSFVPGVGGEKFGVNIPQIAMLESGGIATGPTLSMIGEGREPEAVIPLSRLSSMMGAQPAAAPVNISLNINVNGGSSVSADIRSASEQAAQELKRQLQRLMANERRLAY